MPTCFNRKRQYTVSDIKNPTPYQIVDLILYKVLCQPFLPEVTIKLIRGTICGRNVTDRCQSCWTGFDLITFPLLRSKKMNDNVKTTGQTRREIAAVFILDAHAHTKPESRAQTLGSLLIVVLAKETEDWLIVRVKHEALWRRTAFIMTSSSGFIPVLSCRITMALDGYKKKWSEQTKLYL